VADVNDRLERLSKREELARRAHQPPPTGVPAAGLGEGFLDVLAAVARAVQRHPGLSVMVAVVDGRPGRVVRVTERDGAVETALVATPGAPAGVAEPGRHAHPAAPAPASASAAVPPDTPAPTDTAAAAPAAAAGPAGPGVWYHRPTSDRQPYSRHSASRPLRTVGEARPGPHGHSADPAEDGGDRPPGAERQPGTGANGLVTLPADTSQVVARLAQLLRDDPSLASGWGRDR
jgi:hypothetical protein